MATDIPVDLIPNFDGRVNPLYPSGDKPVGGGALLASDDFESYAAGDSPSGTNGILTWEGNQYTEVIDANSASGTKSLQFKFLGNADPGDSIAEQRFSLDKRYKELWITYKMFIPANYTHAWPSDNVNNNKGLIDLWGGGDAGYSGYAPLMAVGFAAPTDSSFGVLSPTNPNGSIAYVAVRNNSGTPYSSYNRNGHDLDYVSANSDMRLIESADIGTWVTFVMHFKTSSYDPTRHDRGAIGDGICEVWKNGVKKVNYTTMGNFYDGLNGAQVISDPTVDGWDSGYILGYANSGFREETKILIDDIKIGETMESIGASVS